MRMMTPKELATPPTPLEMAELAAAATTPDYQLSEAGIRLLRRLTFAYERSGTLRDLKFAIEEIRAVIALAEKSP